MAVTLLERPDPALRLRPTSMNVGAARGVLTQLRRETEFAVPDRILSFWEERDIRQRARARAVTVIKAVRNRAAEPTDLPVEWVGPGAPTTMLEDIPVNKGRNALWNKALKHWRRVTRVFDLEQQVEFLKSRQAVLLEYINQWEEADIYMLRMKVEILNDLHESFDRLPAAA